MYQNEIQYWNLISVLLIKKMHSCFQSQPEIKLQAPQSHWINFSPDILLHGRPRICLVIVSVSGMCSAMDCGEQSPYSRHFILYPNPEWTLLWCPLKDPGGYLASTRCGVPNIIFILVINKTKGALIWPQKKQKNIIWLIRRSVLFFHLAYVRYTKG